MIVSKHVTGNTNHNTNHKFIVKLYVVLLVLMYLFTLTSTSPDIDNILAHLK